jgi:hypothetical protein
MPTALSAMYGLPLGLLLSRSPVIICMTCLLAVLTTEITKDPFMFWRLPIILSSVFAVVLMIVSTIFPNYLIDTRWLVGLFILGWVASLVAFQKDNSNRINPQVVVPIALFSGVFSIWVAVQPWNPIDGFLKITQFGEDNGAWLNNIAFSITDSGSQIGAQSSVGGGVLLGVISSLGAQLIRASQDGAQQFDSAAVVLWRLYLLLLLFGCVAAISTVVKLVKARGIIINVVLGSLVASVCSAYMMGLIGPGYFTALIAVVWLSSSIEILSFASEKGPKGLVIILTCLSLNLFAVGEAWFPTYLVGLGMISIVISRYFLKVLAKPRATISGLVARTLKLRRRTKFAVAFSLGFAVVAAKQFFDGTFVLYISNPNSLKELMGTGGNVGIANPLFSSIILILAVSVLFKPNLPSEQTVLGRLVLVCAFAATFVLFAALLTPPYYEIRYGPSKLFVIIATALVPIALSNIANWLKQFHSLSIRSASLLSLVVLIFAIQMGSPIGALNVISRPDAKPTWFDGVVSAKKAFPERIPLCLNTDRGVGRSERAYECSRLSIGLAGGDRSELAGALSTFQWGNICTISADRAAKNWTKEFFEKISIVVTNPNRLSAENDCHSLELTETNFSPYGKLDGFDVWPIGWLSTIKWGSIELFDMKGKPASPSFDYLINDTDNPDPLNAAKLTRELLSKP